MVQLAVCRDAPTAESLLYESTDPPEARLRQLRRVAVAGGLDADSRRVAWKLLLGVGRVDSARYAALLARGPCAAHQAIRDDARRTFRSDNAFRDRVGEESIVRVLTALSHQLDGPGRPQRRAQRPSGANRSAVAATLLYALPSELEAFWCLEALVSSRAPSYFTPTLRGAAVGAALADAILERVDAELHARLTERSARAVEDLVAFPLLASFFACAPPLAEVVVLWDAAFAAGAHFFVLCCVALCVARRGELLEDADPVTRLQPRRLPPLDARQLIAAAVAIPPRLPEALMELLLRHPTGDVDRSDVEGLS